MKRTVLFLMPPVLCALIWLRTPTRLNAMPSGSLTGALKTSFSDNKSDAGKTLTGGTVFSCSGLKGVLFGETSGTNPFAPETAELKNLSLSYRDARFKLQAGSAYYYRIYSRLNNPKITVPQALKTPAASSTGTTFTVADISSAKRPLSLFAAAVIPLPEHVQKTVVKPEAAFLWVQDLSAYTTVHIPLRKKLHHGTLRADICVAAGLIQERYVSAALETTVKTSWTQLFVSAGMRRQPALSGTAATSGTTERTAGFVRIEHALHGRQFVLNWALFSCSPDYTGYAGTVVREPFHAYINPQISNTYNGSGFGKLTFGVVFDTAAKYTSAKKTATTVYGTVKASLQWSRLTFSAVQHIALKNMYIAQKSGKSYFYDDCLYAQWEDVPHIFGKETAATYDFRLTVQPLWFTPLDRLCTVQFSAEAYPGKDSAPVYELGITEKLYPAFTHRKSGTAIKTRLTAGALLEIRNAPYKLTVKTQLSCGNLHLSGQAVQSYTGRKNTGTVTCSWRASW